MVVIIISSIIIIYCLKICTISDDDSNYDNNDIAIPPRYELFNN
jgi:hypothetical protein